LKKTLALLLFATLLSCHPKGVIRLLTPAHPVPDSDVKVGIALGGGGARGFAEIGVLRALEREGIPISCVAGTSAGSLIGALYCDAGSEADLEYHAATIEKNDVFDFSVFSLIAGPGLVKGDKLEEFLRNNLRHKVLEDLPVPLTVVATDMRTGEKMGFDMGAVEIAVHASCAMPGIFQPVQIGSTVFVDGGMSDPVPVDFVDKMGADVVIAVVIPPEFPEELPQKAVDIFRYSLSILFSRITEYLIRDADVIIRPKCADVRFNDFSKRAELIAAGEAAAREAIPKIRELIAKKKGK